MINKKMLHCFCTFPRKSEETGWPGAHGECKEEVETPQERLYFFVVGLFWSVFPIQNYSDVKRNLAVLWVREPTVSPGLSFPPAVFALWPDLVAVGAIELLLMSPVGQQVPCPLLGGGRARRTCCFKFCPAPRWWFVGLQLTVQSSFWARPGGGPPEL